MNKIKLPSLLTLQEHCIIGSLDPELEKAGKWHTPVGVLRGKITVYEAIKERERLGFFEGGALCEYYLHLPDVAIRLEAIDPKIGETVSDPTVLGALNEDGKIVKIEGRDLTRELYGAFSSNDVDLHLREKRSDPEVEMRRGVEVER